MTKLLPHGLEVRWLGHATFDVRGSMNESFLVDPFLENNPAFPKELTKSVCAPGRYKSLLVSHPHSDHFEDVVPLLKNDPALKVVAQFEIGEWIGGQGIKEEQIVGMNTGGTTELSNVRITMVPAIHTSSVRENGTPRALGCPVGYVLQFFDGFTLYYTGDTAVTMDMKIVRDLYNPDLVILPIGDFYTMGPAQAAYALNLLQPRLALGIHWGTWGNMPPGTPEALEKELARYKTETRVIKLKPGESLS